MAYVGRIHNLKDLNMRRAPPPHTGPYSRPGDGPTPVHGQLVDAGIGSAVKTHLNAASEVWLTSSGGILRNQAERGEIDRS